ncbi:5-formyltetrahydrofolate cyclo-ligase [Pseudopontixanthobacter vadosimaris]|uniref:5-formyltetrahydrofolate cyclo-ligase n=1 Tax=Pseudopontixanthobacter vadosimaris TaxID=2726450 RepID=UPI001472F779|nr:5-formyltetrahydrofolate cyclo-ligase [Pseudopontixanthobacter vadosimaris]
MQSKVELRKSLRRLRREHVASLDERTRALLFMRPPGAALALVPDGASVGLYHAAAEEAPAARYAQFFQEAGHDIALPRFQSEGAPMQFARHSDPLGGSDLVTGPYGLMQPAADADILQPRVLFVPLLGFAEDGGRIGRGGGHYDAYLAAHPDVVPIGLAWDVQRVDDLPQEAHDIAMRAIVTPTRIFGPF